MNKLAVFLGLLTTILKSNLGKIIGVIASIIIFYLAYLLTSYSLKKLKPEIISYYPFDKFFPKSGRWSVIYFLITLILLGTLIYFYTKGGFYLAPA